MPLSPGVKGGSHQLTISGFSTPASCFQEADLAISLQPFILLLFWQAGWEVSTDGWSVSLVSASSGPAVKHDSGSPDCPLLSEHLCESTVGDNRTKEPGSWILTATKHGTVTQSQHCSLQKNIYFVYVTQRSSSELRFKYWRLTLIPGKGIPSTFTSLHLPCSE